jgi:hypothetical protein
MGNENHQGEGEEEDGRRKKLLNVPSGLLKYHVRLEEERLSVQESME